jgi:hypothetical protein
MRRTLVLTDESARHPFLASLPPHVRFVPKEGEAEAQPRWTMQDMREFLMAYCACFLAVSTFIY